MGTFVNRKTTRAWRSTPSWAPGPACPVPSLSCPSPGCWGVFPGMAPLPSLSCPSPRCRGALPRKAPLPSLSCPSLGCRGALPGMAPLPSPQQRPPTSLRGQGVRRSREGGCSSSERGARPRLFKSHLGKALAKHLLVPKGFPCEVCNVQTQPANPRRRVRGISRAPDERGCDVREAESSGGGEDRVPAPASGRVQGSRIKPSSPGAGRGPGRALGRGGQLSIGASFLFRSRAGTACW